MGAICDAIGPRGMGGGGGDPKAKAQRKSDAPALATAPVTKPINPAPTTTPVE
ncbi:hypothetical protein MYBA111488_00900 [Mycobacterium basiliense]